MVIKSDTESYGHQIPDKKMTQQKLCQKIYLFTLGKFPLRKLNDDNNTWDGTNSDWR